MEQLVDDRQRQAAELSHPNATATCHARRPIGTVALRVQATSRNKLKPLTIFGYMASGPIGI